MTNTNNEARRRPEKPNTPHHSGAHAGLEPAAWGGLLLLASAAVALALANSPWADTVQGFWQTKISVGSADFGIHKPLLLWINDGLMAVFFLLVGLEIKRELLEGALSTRRRAMLPVLAAIGGIAVPALIYTLVNMDGGDPNGWAVPAATDIAFALGILSLLGRRVPIELKVFLTAVAVVDDLGAILIIAVFFSESVSLNALIAAAIAMSALILLGRRGIRSPIPYVVLGIVLWVCVLKSGLHATVAGVLLAAAIPATRRVDPERFATEVGGIAKAGDQASSDALAPNTTMHRVRDLLNDVESPLLRWEHALSPYVLFFIMPIFALANSGVSIVTSGSGLGPVGWGVALGLLLGKPVGVFLGAWLGVRVGLSDIPKAVDWRQVHAAGWLAGIGFTMSLFISGLALEGNSAAAAKMGLLLGSFIAGLAGTFLVYRATSR